MKRIRTQLLATAAVVALGGSAYAADMGVPMKAPQAPPPIPYTNWQGFYVGGFVGVGRLNETQQDTYPNGGKLTTLNSTCGAAYTFSCAISTTGVVGGVEVGYDWQNRYFVYGVVADWMATDLSHSTGSASGISQYSHTAKVDWLASFRGRMGLAVDDTLVYLTGGLALGHLKSHGEASDSAGVVTSTALNTVKAGWVAGMGVEHKFTPNWSGKAEFLYYDLGRTSNAYSSTDPSTGTYTSTFTHEIFVGKVGVAYHF
jgi:outer membrane immunogenic protein